MKAYWGSGGIAPRILLPRQEMEVSGQLQAPAALVYVQCLCNLLVRFNVAADRLAFSSVAAASF
jgi:phosphatidylserine synthase